MKLRRFSSVLILLSAVVILFLVAALFTGCANSGIDRDFRSKVSSATVTTQGNWDRATGNAGGTVSTTLQFRDPSK